MHSASDKEEEDSTPYWTRPQVEEESSGQKAIGFRFVDDMFRMREKRIESELLMM